MRRRCRNCTHRYIGKVCLLLLVRAQGGTEISWKMCSIRNQSRMGAEGTFWNLRSEGYEMGIAKGRAFSAKRSVGHFRVGRMPSAIPKKCEITMESMYLLSLHKKLAFDCTSVSDYISENIRPRPRARPRGHGNCSSCYAGCTVLLTVPATRWGPAAGPIVDRRRLGRRLG